MPETEGVAVNVTMPATLYEVTVQFETCVLDVFRYTEMFDAEIPARFVPLKVTVCPVVLVPTTSDEATMMLPVVHCNRGRLATSVAIFCTEGTYSLPPAFHAVCILLLSFRRITIHPPHATI